MYKHIELDIISTDDSNVEFKIGTQTHRGDNFGVDGSNYFKTTHLVLRSEVYPQAFVGSDLFCLRGSAHKYDNQVLNVTRETFQKLQMSIHEYNDYFSEPLPDMEL